MLGLKNISKYRDQPDLERKETRISNKVINPVNKPGRISHDYLYKD